MKGRSWNGDCIFKQSFVKWMLVYRRQEQAPEREGRNKGFREYHEVCPIILSFLCQAKVFNICSSASLDEDAMEQMSVGDPALKEWLHNQSWALTMIAGPNGQPCCPSIENNQEGII